MDKRKIVDYIFIGFGLLVLAGSVSGCGESEKEPQADIESIHSEPGKRIIEAESSVLSDDIFYWGAEKYFDLLEGEWVAREYAGSIRDFHSDETMEEGYQEELREYTDEVIEKYLGSKYCVEKDKLVYFGPYVDLDLIMHNDDELFFATRFIPGEFVTITPPYIGLSVQLADKDEMYQFIIDADGTVLLEIEYCFFRLERVSDKQTAGDGEETEEVCTDISENGEDDTDYVFYLEDEGVRNNPVFAAFIDKEIPAYDLEIGENRYIYECKEYCEYYKYGLVPPVFGLHYMVEDLDGDGEDELLALLQWNSTDGDLLVFHEKDGKLYQWETWDNFLWMRMMDIEYYGNGVFSQGGGGGDIFGYYNAAGKIEYIVDFSTWWEQEGEEWLPKSRLVLYKDGIEEKKLEYEGTH